MVALPAFYIDNVRLMHTDTSYVRGNVVHDLIGNGAVTGIEVTNCNNLRYKNNKVFRIRSKTGASIAHKINDCNDALLIYNTVSRAEKGFVLSLLDTLNVYNLTSHACTTHIESSSSGLFRNIALSAYEDSKYYKNCTGFVLTGSTIINLDYCYYFNLAQLNSGGTVTSGAYVSQKEILYFDEANDDLTPDHISETVNSGIDNPLRINEPCIGGVESEITSEQTADRKFQYDLLDNMFWDISNAKSGEMSFIKSFQSRILANAETAIASIDRNAYIKFADSTLKFAEMFPMNAYYHNSAKYKRCVMDLWYATQNVGVIQAYNNAIGGYNLFPSYFKRLEDADDFWIIAESDIAINNWLLGMFGQKYGIVIDVLGTSTISQSASGECYNNVMKSVADIAPVYWDLHNEAQPPNYILFTDLYNGFENCTLTNMIYDDHFAIVPDDPDTLSCSLLTPLIATDTVPTTGAAASGYELSTLDRINSENITRRIYYKQGDSSLTMPTSWTEIDHPIGEVITRTHKFIQFYITVENASRRIDYEFLGLCLRPYFSSRDWIWQDNPNL